MGLMIVDLKITLLEEICLTLCLKNTPDTPRKTADFHIDWDRIKHFRQVLISIFHTHGGMPSP
jgi:hypothetical protein